MAMILLLLLVNVAIAALWFWFWIKSLIIMKDNTPFLILGIFLSPIPQLIYFFTKQEEMGDDEISTMKKYLIAIFAFIILIFTHIGISAS